jgi:hypothetical protein
MGKQARKRRKVEDKDTEREEDREITRIWGKG